MTTIVAGSPGDPEKTTEGMCDGLFVAFPQLVGTQAACANSYGYGTLNIVNRTHLHWKWEETGPATPLEVRKRQEINTVFCFLLLSAVSLLCAMCFDIFRALLLKCLRNH